MIPHLVKLQKQSHLLNATKEQLRLDKLIKEQFRDYPNCDYYEFSAPILSRQHVEKLNEVIDGYRKRLRGHFEIGYITFGKQQSIHIIIRHCSIPNLDECLESISNWSPSL